MAVDGCGLSLADWTPRCDELEALAPLLPAAQLSPEATWVGFRDQTTDININSWIMNSLFEGIGDVGAFLLDALKIFEGSDMI